MKPVTGGPRAQLLEIKPSPSDLFQASLSALASIAAASAATVTSERARSLTRGFSVGIRCARHAVQPASIATRRARHSRVPGYDRVNRVCRGENRVKVNWSYRRFRVGRAFLNDTPGSRDRRQIGKRHRSRFAKPKIPAKNDRSVTSLIVFSDPFHAWTIHRRRQEQAPPRFPEPLPVWSSSAVMRLATARGRTTPMTWQRAGVRRHRWWPCPGDACRRLDDGQWTVLVTGRRRVVSASDAELGCGLRSATCYTDR